MAPEPWVPKNKALEGKEKTILKWKSTLILFLTPAAWRLPQGRLDWSLPGSLALSLRLLWTPADWQCQAFLPCDLGPKATSDISCLKTEGTFGFKAHCAPFFLDWNQNSTPKIPADDVAPRTSWGWYRFYTSWLCGWGLQPHVPLPWIQIRRHPELNHFWEPPELFVLLGTQFYLRFLLTPWKFRKNSTYLHFHWLLPLDFKPSCQHFGECVDNYAPIDIANVFKNNRQLSSHWRTQEEHPPTTQTRMGLYILFVVWLVVGQILTSLLLPESVTDLSLPGQEYNFVYRLLTSSLHVLSLPPLLNLNKIYCRIFSRLFKKFGTILRPAHIAAKTRFWRDSGIDALLVEIHDSLEEDPFILFSFKPQLWCSLGWGTLCFWNPQGQHFKDTGS